MKSDRIVDKQIFQSQMISTVAVLKIKENSLYQLTDLDVKQRLFDHLDAINTNDSIRILLIVGSALKQECKEYVELFRKILLSGKEPDSRTYDRAGAPPVNEVGIAKFCNAVNQIVLKIAQFKKFIIHADGGTIISPFMNLSLACDYRLVAENSHYKNPYLDLGLVPKGGSAFFLSRLTGFQKAYQILLSADGISAREAKQCGIVDEVVAPEDLFDRALDVARSYAKLPASSLSGIKKLMNGSVGELAHCLEVENKLIFNSVNRAAFFEKLKTVPPITEP